MATREFTFEYMMLDRCRRDCEVYLSSFHNRKQDPTVLWAGDEQKQIDKMRELYDLVPEKPEWLTREQIDAYAVQMGVK